MKKLLLVASLLGVLLSFSASPALASGEPGEIIRLTTFKAHASIVDKKFKRCLARAEKRETPAPPRDPFAICRGWVKVTGNAFAYVSCKPPYLGGEAGASVSNTIRVWVKAWSRSVASGRAVVRAATRIKVRMRATVTAWVECVLPPGPPPPPPSVTVTVKAVTTHDVEGGNIVDLCATITRSDESVADPKDITFSPDEGSMISGTKHQAPSGNWCQGWQTVTTTIDHDVRWSVHYQGKSDSNTMRVLADDW